MLAGGDRRARILQIKHDNDKSFAKISSKDRHESSINGGDSSFRVNYYNGVSGAVPFTWETCPGTPKHAFSEDTSLPPPLTPPPSYLFKQKSSNSGRVKNSRSTIFNSIFPRMSFREVKLRTSTTHEGGGASLSSSSVSSSSLSSSFSTPSTPRDLNINSRSCRSKNNGNRHRRSRSVVNFGLDEDEDKDEMLSAAGRSSSTSCFGGGGGGGGRGYRSSGEGKFRMYRGPMKNVKNTILSFVGGRRGTA